MLVRDRSPAARGRGRRACARTRPTWVFTVDSDRWKSRGELGVAAALGDGDEDLALAGGQRVEPATAPDAASPATGSSSANSSIIAAGDARREGGLAGVHGADRADELRGRASFRRKPLAPARMAANAYSSRSKVVSTMMRGGRSPPSRSAGRGDAVDPGHPHVHEHDVDRRCDRRQLDRGRARRRPRRRPRGRARPRAPCGTRCGRAPGRRRSRRGSGRVGRRSCRRRSVRSDVAWSVASERACSRQPPGRGPASTRAAVQRDPLAEPDEPVTGRRASAVSGASRRPRPSIATSSSRRSTTTSTRVRSEAWRRAFVRPSCTMRYTVSCSVGSVIAGPRW